MYTNPDIDPPLIRYYKFTSCCDANDVVSLSMSGFPGPLTNEPGTYIYVGPAPYYDSYGVALIPGRCYYVETPIALSSLVLTFNTMPPSTQGGLAGDLLYISSNVGDGNNSTCENAVQCPSCESYTFCDACPPDTVDITYTLVDGECVASNGHTSWSFPVNSCLCFVLIPCDRVTPPFLSYTADLNNYLNEFVNVSYGDWDGCVYVSDLNISGMLAANCEGSVDVIIDAEVVCDCESVCYYIEGAQGISYVQYVDESDQLLQIVPTSTAPWLTICSKVYPIVGNVTANYTIQALGSCVDNTCPQKCFKLIDCEDPTNILYSNTYVLLPAAINGSVITIAGFTECWTVEITTDECDCAVNVSILSTSDDCETCKKLVAYKLTSCNNTYATQYTYDDLSEYVGQTVLTDCGCFLVELISYAPPSVQPIVIVTAFDSCENCLRPYYKLTECNTEEEIYTYSDLSMYVDQIVKIANCDECWTVTETNVPDNPGIVTVVNSYENCIDCVTTAPCICTNVRNDNAVAYTYDYIDCFGETQSITVQPGETSPKVCLIRWLEPKECNCLIMTSTAGSSVTSNVLNSTGTLINFRPSWEGIPGTLFIYYNGTQWIMNNSQGQPQYYLPPSKSDCPSGTWKPFSSIPQQTPIVISTVSCQSFYQYFGECNNGVCPSPVYPKRSIRPGYNTPACSAEKYESISCKSSQILYRQVLTLRYGISNCCPEEDEYWLIKKELIDLAALYNPDYLCAPPNCNCGCAVLTDCSCNSCNS